MSVLLFKITRSRVTKLLWCTAIPIILQLAVPAHAHNELDPNFGRQIEAGASLLNIPELTATVQLAKDLQFNGSPMQIGAGLLHVGDRLGYFGTDFELPSYTTARMFVVYDMTQSRDSRGYR